MDKVIKPVESLFSSPAEWVDRRICLCGRARQIRTLGKKLSFAILETPSGSIQCVFQTPFDVPVESIVTVTGFVRQNSMVQQGIPGVELQAKDFQIVSRANPLPFSYDNIPRSRQLRLENRHIDLRNPRIAAIFRVRSALLRYAHEFFANRGFLQITSPRVVGDCARGSAQLLEVDYFGKPAFLSIASILYHGILIAGDLGKVYEIGPLFNANKSRTAISANEFTGIEFSAAYYDRYALMSLTESCILYLIDRLNEECIQDIELLGSDLQSMPKTFGVITYAEALKYLKECGMELEWGQTHEIPAEAASLLAERFDGFFWLLDQPDEQKWFFVKSVPEGERTVCRDFQLWHSRRPRLAEGSERVTEYQECVQRIIRRGFKPDYYQYYLRALEHGVPPFSGAGLGVERLLMLLLDIPNIREVILFPRDPDTLIP